MKLIRIADDLFNRFTLSQKNIKIIGYPTIYGKLRMSLSETGLFYVGSNCIFRSSWWSNKSGGGQEKCNIVIGDGARLVIGNNVGISNSTIYCTKQITIEDDVMIGVNCVIYDTDHHAVGYVDRMNGEGISQSPVTIKKGAWVGGHCIILKGVTIGERSVIGAGSVVAKDVPPDQIWAGNPVRFIRLLEKYE